MTNSRSEFTYPAEALAVAFARGKHAAAQDVLAVLRERLPDAAKVGKIAAVLDDLVSPFDAEPLAASSPPAIDVLFSERKMFSPRELDALVKQAKVEAYEAAAKIADDSREDEEYGHAAFRCVLIAQKIRALEPTLPPSSPARPDGWLDGEIALTAFALAHPDCDVRAVLHGFAKWILAGSPPAWEPQWQPIETAPKDDTNVLLWWPFWVKNRPTIGWFGHRGIQQWVCPEACEGDGEPPTHWMPLPPPPSDQR